MWSLNLRQSIRALSFQGGNVTLESIDVVINALSLLEFISNHGVYAGHFLYSDKGWFWYSNHEGVAGFLNLRIKLKFLMESLIERNHVLDSGFVNDNAKSFFFLERFFGLFVVFLPWVFRIVIVYFLKIFSRWVASIT